MQPPIFAIDFEGNSQRGVWEVGVVRLADGVVDRPLEFFCRRTAPDDPLLRTGDASKLSTGEAPFATYFATFRRLRMEGVFASHGSATEDFLLRRHWPSPGFVPDWLDPTNRLNSWGPWIDSRILGHHHLPQLSGHGLRNSLRACGLESAWFAHGQSLCHPDRRRPHRALFDAIGCALLIGEFIRRGGESATQLLIRCLPSDARRRLRQLELFP
jgi:hypothetical protein